MTRRQSGESYPRPELSQEPAYRGLLAHFHNHLLCTDTHLCHHTFTLRLAEITSLNRVQEPVSRDKYRVLGRIGPSSDPRIRRSALSRIAFAINSANWRLPVDNSRTGRPRVRPRAPTPGRDVLRVGEISPNP